MSADATSPPPAPELSCYGKTAYPSERAAYQVAAKVYQERGTWLRAYPCELCRQYHLTHKRALPPPGRDWRSPAVGRSADDHRDWRRRRGDRGNKRRRYGR